MTAAVPDSLSADPFADPAFAGLFAARPGSVSDPVDPGFLAGPDSGPVADLDFDPDSVDFDPGSVVAAVADLSSASAHKPDRGAEEDCTNAAQGSISMRGVAAVFDKTARAHGSLENIGS